MWVRSELRKLDVNRQRWCSLTLFLGERAGFVEVRKAAQRVTLNSACKVNLAAFWIFCTGNARNTRWFFRQGAWRCIVVVKHAHGVYADTSTGAAAAVSAPMMFMCTWPATCSRAALQTSFCTPERLGESGVRVRTGLPWVRFEPNPMDHKRRKS